MWSFKSRVNFWKSRLIRDLVAWNITPRFLRSVTWNIFLWISLTLTMISAQNYMLIIACYQKKIIKLSVRNVPAEIQILEWEFWNVDKLSYIFLKYEITKSRLSPSIKGISRLGKKQYSELSKEIFHRKSFFNEFSGRFNAKPTLQILQTLHGKSISYNQCIFQRFSFGDKLATISQLQLPCNPYGGEFAEGCQLASGGGGAESME